MTRFSFLIFIGLLEVLLINEGTAFAKSASARKPASASESKKTNASVGVDFYAKPHAIKGNTDSTLRADKPLEVGFTVKDKDSGYGISDLHPAAWVVKRKALERKPDQEACERGIKKFIKGGIINEAYGDLNNYYIISLNADNTIAIFNPLINLATSNLLAIIPLKGKAGSWIFDDSAGRIYVTLPEQNQVAVVDVNARAVDRYIDVGENPVQIQQQPDGRFIWVGNESSGTVSVIDRVTLAVTRTIAAGKGALHFSFDPKRRWTFVSADADGRITTIDSMDFKNVRSLSFGQGEYLLAYSVLSESLFISDRVSGNVTVLYPETGKTVNSLKMPPGATAMKATPDGRHVLVVHESKNTIAIIDSSNNTIVHVLTTLGKPDHINFSRNFAYIHHAGDVHVSIIQLSALSKPEAPPVADVPIGVELPEKVPGLPGVSLLDITPDEGGALIANPADNTVYLYNEGGMLAPSNSFKTYTSPPLGLFIYDHSLTEGSKSGEYSTSLQVNEGGIYDVYFLLSTPLVVTCFEMNVEGDPGKELAKLRKLSFDSLVQETALRPGIPAKIQFRIKDADSSKPLSGITDVRVLAMNRFGNWQVRQNARPVGDGVYEIQLVFPEKGPYQLMVEALSLGLEFGQVGHIYHVATAGNAPSKMTNGGTK